MVYAKAIGAIKYKRLKIEEEFLDGIN